MRPAISAPFQKAGCTSPAQALANQDGLQLAEAGIEVDHGHPGLPVGTHQVSGDRAAAVQVMAEHPLVQCPLHPVVVHAAILIRALNRERLVVVDQAVDR